MKKLIASALLLSFALAGSVSAGWVSGESTVIAVNRGEAAFHGPLSSEQRLDVGMTGGSSGRADVIFSNKSSESRLALSALPVNIESGTSSDGTSYQDAKLTITPLVDNDSGQRYYLVETGNPEGTQIIAYKKGNFTQAFTAASLMEGADSASFTVEKKELTLNLEKGEVKNDYLLTYDSRTGTFNAKQKN